MNFYYATYTVTETHDFGTESRGKFNCMVKADSVKEAESLVMRRARKNMTTIGYKGALAINVEIMETVGY
ncbi:hypothetical protein [Hyphomicrobium sp. MC1]|uniref:hypothetical protein n=1 Tax=Hyphomicrobium sp. (strain MC1) TaxID=717785 RepID=UPI000213EB1B|nr:hypothetical protein [Hyphomicrobium sp. MC1]CCB65382.1 protein of unknown function [Hyphomicrobium sp. MC1]